MVGLHIEISNRFIHDLERINLFIGGGETSALNLNVVTMN